MSEQASQEPTMEEILASIRRIISEDEPPAEGQAPEPAAVAEPVAAEALAAEPEPEAAAPEEDVLELTEKVEDAEAIGDLDVFEAQPEPAFEPEPEPEPVRAAPAPAPAPAPIAAHVPAEESLVSEPIAAAVNSAFGQLQNRVGMPAPNQTLDGVVRELLRPLLKEWLDANLKAIVEAKVEEEIERQSRRLR